MKLCFVCSEYPPAPHGGIGSVTQVLSRALVENGHEVKVIGIYSGIRAAECEDDEGVEVWRLPRPAERWGWVRARFDLYRRIAKWAAEESIELVEVPDWEGMAAGWPALPVPVVTRLHGSSSYFAAELQRNCKRSTFWIERNALRRTDFWCSVSRYTAEKTQALFELNSPGKVIYNAVTIAQPAPVAGRSRTDVVFSGTLTAKKGIERLIQAWPQVKAQVANARLHIFGKDRADPSKPKTTERLFNSLPESARSSVEFHGHVRREILLDHLSRARAAVFPSLAEAFAMAPLEAMAQGCPTIYSMLGSGPELIDDGRDGLLVDPASPQQIAEAIVCLLRNDDLARRLGAAGRERVQRAFSIDRIVRINEDFYAECARRFRNEGAMDESHADFGNHLHV